MPKGTTIQPIASMSKLPEKTYLFEIKGDLMNGLEAFIARYAFTPKVILAFESTFGTVYYIDTKVQAGE